MTNWVAPAVLAACVLLAGICHVVAAYVQRIPRPRAELITQPPTEPAEQSPAEQSPVRSSTEKLTDGRIIVNVSPRHLSGFFQTHTSAQGNKLLEAYLGKWMRLSVTIHNVNIRKWGVMVSTIDGPAVIMQFDKKWGDRLAVLNRDDRITVLGKIDEADESSVTLTDCELVAS